MSKFFIKKVIIFLFLGFNSHFVLANTVILPVDDAFRFSAQIHHGNELVLNWQIAEGFQLYRDAITLNIADEPHALLPATLDHYLPAATPKYDPLIGDYQAYTHSFDLSLPISYFDDQVFSFIVEYQGCADSGFCYPPERKLVTFPATMNTATIHGIITDGWNSDLVTTTSLSSSTEFSAIPTDLSFDDIDLSIITDSTDLSELSEQDTIAKLLEQRQWLWVILGFLSLGLLLAFTPCVLPMIPILSGIIIGQRKGLTTGKAFRLSLTYVVAMAATYAIAGMISAWLGYSLQAVLQKPWIIATFAGIFVLLALSLFGFFELRLPAFLEQRLHNSNQKQQGGTYVSVALMGVLSTLIASACITPALVGVLGFIASTGDIALGATSLFMMGMGMGIPLLIIGTSQGKLLPKAGPWMVVIKNLFGVSLIALAIYIISPIIPQAIELALWAALLIISAMYLSIFNPKPETHWATFWQGIGWLFFIYGIFLMIGAASGHGSLFKPLAQLGNTTNLTTSTQQTLSWNNIETLQQFEQTLAQKQSQGAEKPTLIYLTADWCVECQRMLVDTFADPQLQIALPAAFDLYKIDISDFNNDHRVLLKALGLFGPPTLLFFNAQGEALPEHTLAGFVTVETLMNKVNTLR